MSCEYCIVVTGIGKFLDRYGLMNFVHKLMSLELTDYVRM